MRPLARLDLALDVDGVEWRVEARLERTDELAVTHLVVRDAAGAVVTESHPVGWLDPVRVRQEAERIIRARQWLASLSDPTAQVWTEATLIWRRGRLRLDEVEALPTRSGLTEVRYDHYDGRLVALRVVGCWDEAEMLVVERILSGYQEAAERRYLHGADPGCQHDPAFPVEHDIGCRLVSLDLLAEALQIEVRAVLAVTDDRGQGSA